jgi:hypothetical protein
MPSRPEDRRSHCGLRRPPFRQQLVAAIKLQQLVRVFAHLRFSQVIHVKPAVLATFNGDPFRQVQADRNIGAFMIVDIDFEADTCFRWSEFSSNSR